LVQQPAVQALSAMVRYGGVEKMRQGMSSKEIKVDGVGMRGWSFTGSWRNGRPIQGDACKLGQLDLFPLSKPMNPGFHPVMIRGHGDEEGQEEAEGQITAVVPIELVEGHGADEADEENSQSPAREGRADLGALSDQAICSSDRRFELDRAGACHNRRPYWERTGDVKS